MRKLRKGECCAQKLGLSRPAEAEEDPSERLPRHSIPRNDEDSGRGISYNRKYGTLLSALFDEFNAIDFGQYSPNKVIKRFWSKYHMKDGHVNIFDLMLLAMGHRNFVDHNAEDMDKFLQDFTSFMIAGYVVSFRSEEVGVLGCFLSTKEANDLKESVRIDFFSNLLRLNQSNYHKERSKK